MADNAADRKSIRRKEKRAALADVQRREVITQVMSTSFGRQWIWDQLSALHIFSTTFTSDPYQSAFQEGQRSAGLSLLADILLACPDQYIQAMREANERYYSNDASTSRAGSAEGRAGDAVGSVLDAADYDPYGTDSGDETDHSGPVH